MFILLLNSTKIKVQFNRYMNMLVVFISVHKNNKYKFKFICSNKNNINSIFIKIIAYK